uniref:Uncharacterized protein n=1 Tax=Oncorhynchus kisutch TaxID=8019 RepID=A0A8C7HKC5_ONCKI
MAAAVANPALTHQECAMLSPREKEVLSKYEFLIRHSWSGHLELIDITGRRDMSSLQDYFLEITGSRTVSFLFESFCGRHNSGRLDYQQRRDGLQGGGEGPRSVVSGK